MVKSMFRAILRMPLLAHVKAIVRQQRQIVISLRRFQLHRRDKIKLIVIDIENQSPQTLPQQMKLTLNPWLKGWCTAAKPRKCWNSFIAATSASTACIRICIKFMRREFSSVWLYKRPTQHEHSPWCSNSHLDGLSERWTTVATSGTGTTFTYVRGILSRR